MFTKLARPSRYQDVPCETSWQELLQLLTYGKFGPSPILGIEVETAIVKWIEECARNDFPINKELILDSVQMFVKKENLTTPSRNGRPGRK